MFFEPNLIRLFSFYGTRFAGSGPPATSNIRGGGIGYGPPYGGYHQQGPPPRQPPPPRVSFFLVRHLLIILALPMLVDRHVLALFFVRVFVSDLSLIGWLR